MINKNQTNINGKAEEKLYISSNLPWRPRNNFMVFEEEILMIPGINDFQKEIQKYFCVNYLNRKFNIRMLNEIQLSLYLPFLSLDESKLILQNIKKDFWKNKLSAQKILKEKNFFEEINNYLSKQINFHIMGVNYKDENKWKSSGTFGEFDTRIKLENKTNKV